MRDNDTLAKVVIGLSHDARALMLTLWTSGPRYLERPLVHMPNDGELMDAGLAHLVDWHTYLTADGVRACVLEFGSKEA